MPLAAEVPIPRRRLRPSIHPYFVFSSKFQEGVKGRFCPNGDDVDVTRKA